MVCPRQWQLSAISIWLKCVAYRLSEGRQRHTNNEIRQKGRTAAEEASWALQQKQDKANFLIENQQKYNVKSCKWLTLRKSPSTEPPRRPSRPCSPSIRPTRRMRNIGAGRQQE